MHSQKRPFPLIEAFIAVAVVSLLVLLGLPATGVREGAHLQYKTVRIYGVLLSEKYVPIPGRKIRIQSKNSNKPLNVLIKTNALGLFRKDLSLPSSEKYGDWSLSVC